MRHTLHRSRQNKTGRGVGCLFEVTKCSSLKLITGATSMILFHNSLLSKVIRFSSDLRAVMLLQHPTNAQSLRSPCCHATVNVSLHVDLRYCSLVEKTTHRLIENINQQQAPPRALRHNQTNKSPTSYLHRPIAAHKSATCTSVSRVRPFSSPFSLLLLFSLLALSQISWFQITTVCKHLRIHTQLIACTRLIYKGTVTRTRML